MWISQFQTMKHATNGFSCEMSVLFGASLIGRFLADLVLYCEAFLTTYRTFISPEDLIKKLHYRYPYGSPCLTRALFVFVTGWVGQLQT